MDKADVLIVTYADRWRHLQQVLDRLCAEHAVDHIVIVNNGCPYSVSERTASIHIKKITVIDLPENTGSANAIRIGLEYMQENRDTELMWLLDDDNLPETDCLGRMLDHWRTIPAGERPRTMLLAMRENRPYLQHVAKGGKISRYFPAKNRFFGFHFFRPDIRIAKLLEMRFVLPHRTRKESVRIPCAPYGGLLLHKSVPGIFGYPDTRFITYADDFEFTRRITREGGRIILLPACKITDLDIPSVHKGRKGFLSPKFLALEPAKLYYLVRNTCWFTRNYYVTNNGVFTINRWCYSAYLYCVSLLRGKRASYTLFRKAVHDGLAGDFSRKPQTDVRNEK